MNRERERNFRMEISAGLLKKEMARREQEELQRHETADGLLQIAARRSVETSFGWAHPDCQLLQEAARMLKGGPAPNLDGPHDVVLS